MVAALAPVQLIFCALLLGIGASTLLLQTSANSTVQLAAHDSIRGRIVAIYLLVWLGSGALGGPLLGTIVQHFGPHTGMLLAGALPGGGALLIAAILLAMRLRRG